MTTRVPTPTLLAKPSWQTTGGEAPVSPLHHSTANAERERYSPRLLRLESQWVARYGGISSTRTISTPVPVR